MSSTVLSMEAVQSRNELPQCESIRGIAAILVFWFHYLGGVYGYNAIADLPFGAGLFFGGSTGVTLFFVLSGFLLTRPFFMGRHLDTKQFFARRALRILPMFYVAILIGALTSGHWVDAVKAMFFYDIGLKTLSPMGGVWWSLVIEVQFYLLLPLIIWLASHKPQRLLLIPLFLAGVYAYLMIRSSVTSSDPWLNFRDSLLGRWPVFLCGAILSWGQAQLSKYRVEIPSSLGLPLFLCALVALGWLCDHRVRYYGAFKAHIHWFDYHLLEAAGWTLFIFALLNFRFPGYRLFVNPWLHRIGLWSYSLYLLHGGVLFLAYRLLPWGIEKNWQTTAYGIFLLIAAIAISALTYHWIERPFLRLKPNSTSPQTRQPLPAETGSEDATLNSKLTAQQPR